MGPPGPLPTLPGNLRRSRDSGSVDPECVVTGSVRCLRHDGTTGRREVLQQDRPSPRRAQVFCSVGGAETSGTQDGQGVRGSACCHPHKYDIHHRLAVGAENRLGPQRACSRTLHGALEGCRLRVHRAEIRREGGRPCRLPWNDSTNAEPPRKFPARLFRTRSSRGRLRRAPGGRLQHVQVETQRDRPRSAAVAAVGPFPSCALSIPSHAPGRAATPPAHLSK